MPSSVPPAHEPTSQNTFYAELMRASRKRLLDLSLKNRLLNYAPADPEHRDDGRAHKFLKLHGRFKSVWARLVADDKQLRVFRFNPPELGDALKKLNEALRKASRQESEAIREKTREINEEIAEGEAMAAEGHVWAEKLGDEAYQKRLRRLSDEAKSLEDTTGDSAFFLACGFLRWPEKPKSSRTSVDPAADGVSTFRYAPLVLVKVSLTDEGRGAAGRKQFRIVREDEPQDNQSLKAKLHEEWDFNLPDLPEETTASEYFATVRRAITVSKLQGFEVQETLALGFFNFARYRLWLDLDPRQWKTVSPESHPIVKSILSVSPLDTSCPRVIDATRDETIANEVARHQETEDIPIIRDADASQYSALLYARKGKSIVVIGPPGSGKSQTITNLVATMLANGRRVLFVAQKLPALDVVARRVRESGLGDFCLQFYSARHDGEPDRKPVTPLQIHGQLTKARNVLGGKNRSVSAERRAPLLAKRLNAYASSLHSLYPVYGESIQWILCTARKLKEEAVAAWAHDWNDALLSIALPEGVAPSHDWIEARSRLLTELARLRHEAGDFWRGWDAIKLTVLDVPSIEAAIEGHRRTLQRLSDWCQAVSPALLDWDQAQLYELVDDCSELHLPKNCSDVFIRSLANEDAMRAAHELEQELKSGESAEAAGLLQLALLPEGAGATAAFTVQHLLEVERSVEPTATYGDAKDSLGRLLSLLRNTDVLIETLRLHPDGLSAFAGERAEQVSVALAVAIAQMEDGKFRRAPMLLLPALARTLVTRPTVADEAMLIGDRVDRLMAYKATASKVFGQSLRAEKVVNAELVQQLEEAIASGVGEMAVGHTEALEKAARKLAAAAIRAVTFDASVLSAAADGEGQFTSGRARALAAASETTGIRELTAPDQCDPRLIRAWADGTISEAEARAAACAQEKAESLMQEIAVVIGHSPATADTRDLFDRAVAAADELGLGDPTLPELAVLDSEIGRLETAVNAMGPTLQRMGVAHDLGDYQGVAAAALIAKLIAPTPDLSGVHPGRLTERARVMGVMSAAARVEELRAAVVPGAAKTLTDAAGRIRTCLLAAKIAEESGASLAGIRRPSSLREFRSIGAAIPVLRGMPPLPIGCDMVQLSGEQYASTIRHLVSAAEKLQQRIDRLPGGADYQSLPSSAEARKHLAVFREKRSSLTRIFSGEWRRARSAITRFAPSMTLDDAVVAYEVACSIRSDEEGFAEEPSGAAVIGSFFRGLKTDWKPFVAFAESVEALTRALDGFERNERIVAAWRAENGGINAIANACGQLDAAAAECQAAYPDLFGAADGPFRPDVPIALARERAGGILSSIESLLASPVLALAQAKEHPSVAVSTVTAIVDGASQAEREIVDLVKLVRETLGERFIGRPEDWVAARAIAEWALRIHDAPEFASAHGPTFGLCVAAADHVVKFSHDARVASSALEAVRQTLSHSRIRPDARKSTVEFNREVRERLRTIAAGGALLQGRSNDGVGNMRQASKLISELILELGRSERLRSAVAPRVPSTTSVEMSLGWALSLAAQGMPPALVAFAAESGRAGEVKAFLCLCVDFWREHAALKGAGCGAAHWLEEQSHVRDAGEKVASLGDALEAARRVATDCGAKAECPIREMHSGADAVRSYVELHSQSPAWIETLGCDPFSSESPGEAIRQTIFWVESLHADRVPVGVMSWLVSAHADERIQWWSSLVRESKAWRKERTAIRQSSLPEFDDRTLLADWRADLSTRQASLSLAVEQLGRVVKRPDASLVAIRRATDWLRAGAEAKAKAELIRVRIAGAATLRTAAEVEENRTYARWIADRPTEVSSWARSGNATVVCDHLAELGPLLNEKVVTWQHLSDTMESFGTVDDDGPSGILSEEQTVKEACESSDAAVANLHGLASWAALQRESKRAAKLGVDRIATEALEKRATPEQAMAAFKAAVAWQKALVVWKENPALERFRSSRHEDMRAEFAKEDTMAVSEQNRQRIVAALKDRTGGGMASWGNGYADQLLLSEASKRRKLMPIRRLVENAGKRMQELCPCWLATPAAIAQFMPPGAADFDLVIMDEASQLTPEDSWGAIARGSQVVVVGDPKQMPPSNFFENTADDDEEEREQENPEAVERPQGPILKGHQQESVLKAAEASLPQVWLNWHYRSLHERLIAAANALSYESRLVLFPSSHLNHRHLGIRHTYVPDGTATTGQVKNANEASAVVERLAVIAEEFASPSHRRDKKGPHSVGVIAMNIHQQEVIKDLIDLRKNNEPMFARNLAVLEANETEPLFVRNLENVQGDERDVILISTTYGPNTPGGTPTQRFFPINQEGGERRFNVLITRAKWRMEVLTSLRSNQLTSAQLGVQHMRSFLEYCESNVVPSNGAESGRWFDSPFEAHVHAVLEAKGYSVAKQVGVAGYFLDLAIKDPLVPDRYVLGIECDGATYHSSRAARDRDRLRENVLNERGWKVHRVWSTEWFYNNAAVRRGLFEAVESALSRK
jgi:very-short-patch-repair endonuclease